MTQDPATDHSFLADIKAELDAERDADYSVTPEEGQKLRERYPRGLDAAWSKIDPEEFFDGAL